MGTNKLYHIKREIASAAAEFAGITALLTEIMMFWEIAAAISHGTKIPAWCGAAACVFVCVVIICAARAAVIRLSGRRIRRARRGVIDAGTICRIMEGKK